MLLTILRLPGLRARLLSLNPSLLQTRRFTPTPLRSDPILRAMGKFKVLLRKQKGRRAGARGGRRESVFGEPDLSEWFMLSMSIYIMLHDNSCKRYTAAFAGACTGPTEEGCASTPLDTARHQTHFGVTELENQSCSSSLKLGWQYFHPSVAASASQLQLSCSPGDVATMAVLR